MENKTDKLKFPQKFNLKTLDHEIVSSPTFLNPNAKTTKNLIKSFSRQTL